MPWFAFQALNTGGCRILIELTRIPPAALTHKVNEQPAWALSILGEGSPRCDPPIQPLVLGIGRRPSTTYPSSAATGLFKELHHRVKASKIGFADLGECRTATMRARLSISSGPGPRSAAVGDWS